MIGKAPSGPCSGRSTCSGVAGGRPHEVSLQGSPSPAAVLRPLPPLHSAGTGGIRCYEQGIGRYGNGIRRYERWAIEGGFVPKNKNNAAEDWERSGAPPATPGFNGGLGDDDDDDDPVGFDAQLDARFLGSHDEEGA